MSQSMKQFKEELEEDTRTDLHKKWDKQLSDSMIEEFGSDLQLSNPIEPNHYTSMTISPLEYIEANPEAFTWCTANVIKYVSRAKKKNGLEDLKKAAWYLNHEIENMEKSK